jgi:hypothetical protein
MGRVRAVRVLSPAVAALAALLAGPPAAHAATKWPSCNVVGLATYRLDSPGGCPSNQYHPWRMVRVIHCDTGAIGGCDAA